MPKTKTTPRKSAEERDMERWLCPVCPAKFTTKDIRDKHIIECTDSRLFCDLCSYNTNKRAYLNKHIKNVHCSVAVEEGELSVEESSGENKDKNNNEATGGADKEKSGTHDDIKIMDKKSESDDSGDSDGPQHSTRTVDNSRSLFEDISSDDEDSEVQEVEPADVNQSSGQDKEAGETKESATSGISMLEEGRTIRKITRPAPVPTPKRRIQDLRQKLTKGLQPQLVSTPKTHEIRRAQMEKRPDEKGDAEPKMVTKYIKIITEYEKDGKKIRVIEKKLPA